jgi:hypothetical protein
MDGGIRLPAGPRWSAVQIKARPLYLIKGFENGDPTTSRELDIDEAKKGFLLNEKK